MNYSAAQRTTETVLWFLYGKRYYVSEEATNLWFDLMRKLRAFKY